MDILKARQKAKKAEEDKDKKTTEVVLEPKSAAKPKAKKSGAKKSKPEKSESAAEITEKVAEPEKPAKREIPYHALAPEEMELTEEDLNGLYKTQEMPELPHVEEPPPQKQRSDIPQHALAPEEMELTEEDLNGLYKTQEMPELPEHSDMTFGAPKPEKKHKAAHGAGETPKNENLKKTLEKIETRKAQKESVEEVFIPEVEINTHDHYSEFEEYGESVGAVEVSEQPLDFLSFMLGKEEYALPLARISEIIKPREITEVPRCPEFVLGILSLRGTVIPVFDLAARLKLGQVKWGRQSRIMIVRRPDGDMVGLTVDKVQDVVRVLPSDIEPPPPAIGGLEGQYLEGVGRAEESRRVHTEAEGTHGGIGEVVRKTAVKRKLVILLNLDKVAVL